MYQGRFIKTRRRGTKPGVTAAHAHGKVGDERHRWRECTLKNEEDKQRKREISTIAKKFRERESKNSKIVVIKNQTSTPYKVEAQLFGNWQELKWHPKILHHDGAPLTYVLCLQYVSTPWVTHMQEQCMCVALDHNKIRMKCLCSMHSQTVRKEQNFQIQRLHPLDMSDFTCKTKSMSTPETW